MIFNRYVYIYTYIYICNGTVWKQCSHLQVTGGQSNNAGFIHLSRESCRYRQQLCQLQKFLVLPVAADTRCLLAFFLHYDFLRAGRASDRIVVQRVMIVRAQIQGVWSGIVVWNKKKKKKEKKKRSGEERIKRWSFNSDGYYFRSKSKY